MKLTTCLNCGTVYEDMNPSDKSIEYPELLNDRFTFRELPIIKHTDDNHIGYGCAYCLTDGHLQDNVNGTVDGLAKNVVFYILSNNIPLLTNTL